MREIFLGAFVGLDGVMQAPGAPEEDPSGGFESGGWVAGFGDQEIGPGLESWFAEPFDLLLGRNTYDIFAAHWPFAASSPDQPGFDEGEAAIARQFNSATKYVATHRVDDLPWANSVALGEDTVAAIRGLKQTEEPRLLVQGSCELLHLLLANGLLDQMHLLIFPLVFGRGKRLFDGSAQPSGFTLQHCASTSNGVIMAQYVKAGGIPVGSFALKEPSEVELERRRKRDAFLR